MARVTNEDCLERIPNRFLLCNLASRRARNLMQGAPATMETKNKSNVTALREIAAGLRRIPGQPAGPPQPVPRRQHALGLAVHFAKPHQ